MTFVTDQALSRPAGLFGAVPAVVAEFETLSTDERLGLLWFIYKEMGRGSVTPAATGAARLQFAEGLLQQVKDLSNDEQLNFMRALINQENTPMTRAYSALTNNTKLAFWYQLAVLMESGEVIGVPSYYSLSGRAQVVYQRVVGLEFGQQITVLRQAVIKMGYDSFA